MTLLPLLALLLQGDPLLQWMDKIAQAQLDLRAAAVAKIHNRQEAEDRKNEVRAALLHIIGGLPDRRSPLNARVTATLNADGYRIENVHFQSFPSYYVTANLYVPDSPGKHPAILHPMGHWEEGKAAAQLTAANLARKGFVVLAYDPHGQGERLQAYDIRLGRSVVGQGTEQHLQDGARSILLGETFARYRIWDGIRALDYLVTRPEVDPDRIGCTGCSGGGTLTVYLSALDDRIKVAAPACYVNTFRYLFSGPTGDSEQSFPGFLFSGLDLPDWIELAAPKPYLMLSTREDFFPLEGARRAFEEAQRFWGFYGADDKVKWAVGPGPHGIPLELREAIYGWMIRHLMNGQGSPKEEPVKLFPDHLLWVTNAGHVNADLGSLDLVEILKHHPRTPSSVDNLRAEIRRISAEPAPAFPLKTQFLAPTGPAKSKAILWVESNANPAPTAHALAGQGYPVLVVWPRGLPLNQPSRDFSGDWISNERAWLIGLNLPGLRATDIIRATNELARQAPGNPIQAAAQGVPGYWLLLAAAIEPRITSVWLDRTPDTLWRAIERPVHRDLHDIVIPGFALHWDTPELVKAIAPRPILWTDPTDWVRRVTPWQGPYRYRAFGESDIDLIRSWLAE